MERLDYVKGAFRSIGKHGMNFEFLNKEYGGKARYFAVSFTKHNFFAAAFDNQSYGNNMTRSLGLVTGGKGLLTAPIKGLTAGSGSAGWQAVSSTASIYSNSPATFE